MQWDIIQIEKKKGILPYVTACMNLENTVLG